MRGEELRRQPRLPHSRRAEHREELARAVVNRLSEGVSKSPQLRLAADHAASRSCGRARACAEISRNAGTGLAFPFSVSGSTGSATTAPRDERERLGADQHLARSRGLLQAGRDVDRIARREPLGRAGDDLAGRDADPPVDPELGEGVAHLDRRPAGAKGVVLVQHGHAEDRHHRVADELLDRAAVCLDDSLHPLEVAREQRPQRLRIRRLAQRGRAGHVAEQHRHRLSLLACRRAQSRTAPRSKGRSGSRPRSPGRSSHRSAQVETRPPASDPEAAARPSIALHLTTTLAWTLIAGARWRLRGASRRSTVCAEPGASASSCSGRGRSSDILDHWHKQPSSRMKRFVTCRAPILSRPTSDCRRGRGNLQHDHPKAGLLARE